jgi:hypothetical protein
MWDQVYRHLVVIQPLPIKFPAFYDDSSLWTPKISFTDYTFCEGCLVTAVYDLTCLAQACSRFKRYLNIRLGNDQRDVTESAITTL